MTCPYGILCWSRTYQPGDFFDASGHFDMWVAGALLRWMGSDGRYYCDLYLDMEAIGAEVRRLRMEREWTVYQLAGRLCCSQPHVTYLEGGRRAVWLPVLWDLADVFDLPPGHFVAVADQAQAGRRTMRRVTEPPEAA